MRVLAVVLALVLAVAVGNDVYGTYPEIDGLFSEQANETNLRVRTQILHEVQPHGLNLIQSFAYSAPYEELTLKAK